MSFSSRNKIFAYLGGIGIVGFIIATFFTHARHEFLKVDSAKEEANVELYDLELDFQETPTIEDFYAYFWYASTSEEFCAAFASFKRLQNLRKHLANTKNVDYVILYYESVEVNPEIMSILELWQLEGGLIGPVNATTDDFESQEVMLKFFSYKFDYQWIVLMDPLGIPLQPMDELFQLFNTDVSKKFGFRPAGELTNLALPKASIKEERELTKGGLSSKKPFCPNPSELGTTAMMVIQPLIDAENRILAAIQSMHDMKRPSRNGLLKDLFLINEEFSCHDEILTLPPQYCIHDEQLFSRNNNNRLLLDSAKFIFTGPAIHPLRLDSRKQKHVLSRIPNGHIRAEIKGWISEVREICYNI